MCVQEKVSHQSVLSIICDILSLTDICFSDIQKKFSYLSAVFILFSSRLHTKQADMWIHMKKVVTQNKWLTCLIFRHPSNDKQWSCTWNNVWSWAQEWLTVRYNVTLTPSCHEIDWLAKSVYITQISCRSSIVPWNPSAAVFSIKRSRRRVPSFELLEQACPKIRCRIPTQLQLWRI